jgi:glycosyltransferase involved in cell wall biosynthesis
MLNSQIQVIQIVFVQNESDHLTGISKIAFQLTSRLSKTRRSVGLWIISPEPLKTILSSSFEIRYFQASGYQLGIPEEIRDAVKKIEVPTIFHVHGGSMPIYSQISQYFKRYGFKLALTPYGAFNGTSQSNRGWAKRLEAKSFDNLFLKDVDIVQCLCEEELNNIRRIYPGVKTKIFSYGYSFQDFGLDYVKTRNSIMKIFIPVPLSYNAKNIELVFSSLSRVLKKGIVINIFILCSTENKIKIKKLAEKYDLEGVSQIFDEVSGVCNSSIYISADIFVGISSSIESLQPVLEACISGLPVLIPSSSPFNSKIRRYQNGWVVQFEDGYSLDNAFTEAVDLWELDLLSGKGSKGPQMVKTEFNWDDLIPNYEGIYQNL